MPKPSQKQSSTKESSNTVIDLSKIDLSKVDPATLTKLAAALKNQELAAKGVRQDANGDADDEDDSNGRMVDGDGNPISDDESEEEVEEVDAPNPSCK